jgi:hypothetical protein
MSSPRFLHYTYYHCARRKAKCLQKSIEVRELENQIQTKLQCIELPTKFTEWAFEYLQELFRQEIDTARHATHSREKAYADCVKRLQGLVKLKTSPENIDGSLLSDEEYSKQRLELLQEKARLQSPETIRIEAEQAVQSSEEAFEFAHSARKKFAQGDFREKKQILTTMGSNLTLIDKKLIIEAKKPFVLIEKFKSSDGTQNEPVEPKNPQANTGWNNRPTYEFSRRLRDVKEVRNSERKKKQLIKSVYHFFRSLGKSCPCKRCKRQQQLPPSSLN